MSRVAALAAAVVMIVVSVAIRAALDDGGRGAAGPDHGTALVLVCVHELADACREVAADDGLAVRVEAAGETFDRMVGGAVPAPGRDADNTLEVWVTFEPWPEMVRQARDRTGRPPAVGPSSDPVARSPLGLVTWGERAAAVEACPADALSWRCVGEIAGRPWPEVGGQPTWGEVKVGHPAPATSASGLLLVGQAAAGFFGRADITAADLGDDAFLSWFTNLERALVASPAESDDLVRTMLLQGAAALDVAGVVVAPAARLRAQAAGARAEDLTIVAPPTAATADVVLAPLASDVSGDSLPDVADALGDALERGGWERPGGDGTLPPTNGLPPAGVLEALRNLALEVTR